MKRAHDPSVKLAAGLELREVLKKWWRVRHDRGVDKVGLHLTDEKDLDSDFTMIAFEKPIKIDRIVGWSGAVGSRSTYVLDQMSKGHQEEIRDAIEKTIREFSPKILERASKLLVKDGSEALVRKEEDLKRQLEEIQKLFEEMGDDE